MIRHGEPPYLECSTRGDRRFSAFVARIISRDFRTIEELYQSFKVFPKHLSGIDKNTGHMLNWRHAKGLKALNQTEAVIFYDTLWKEYIRENPSLLQVLLLASGLSDVYGQEGSCCQATSLWNIRNKYLTNKTIW